ncbi:MAG TPA: c-type cytochrome [Gemmatimonadaceae bacterium]|nr:c-type cytochrome [Gemmatimonadaceae bacterium]
MIHRSVARRLAVQLAAGAIALGTATAQQPSQRFENLKVFPKDIPRDTLLQIMRGFTFALGVRCQYCHVQEPAPAQAEGAAAGGPGGPPRERFNFPSDDKEAKHKARFMLRMTDSLNRVVLAALPNRREPAVRIGCVTCHHGSPVPQTLESTLAEAIDKFGTDSAVARYERLRQDMTSGRFDFGESSLSELARTLGERGKTAEAVAMLQLNQKYYPASAEIDLQLGELYVKRGEKDKAVERFRSVLARRPNDMRVRRRLQELGATP